MALTEKIKSIINRLEEIKWQRHLDLERLREQINTIENEELLKLDDEYDELINSMYDEGEPDEKAEQHINQIGDLFIQAYDLINSIREQFGIEDVYDDENFDDEDDYCDDGDDDKYVIVLNEVSKSVLKAIGVKKIDEQTVNLMGTILAGISSKESDDSIAGRAFTQLVLSGFILHEDDIKKMCKETREKCWKQLLGLRIAYSSMIEYNCSAEDALSQIQLLL